MRYYRLLLYTLLLLIPLKIHTQNENKISLDSFKKLRKQIKTYQYQYNYSEAIKNSSSLIEEAKKNNNDFYEFYGLIELGFVHHLINDSIKAKTYTESALEKAIETKADTLILWAYNDLANVQKVTKSNYTKMIGYYQKAIDISNNTPEASLPVAEHMNIGNAYITVEQPEKAYYYLKKAKDYLNQEKRHELFYLNLNILFGRYYNAIGDYKKAIQTLETSLSLAEEKYLNQTSSSYKYLAIAYEKLKKPSKANKYLRLQQAVDLKLHNLEKDVLLAETSAKFEIDLYEKEIDAINMEKINSQKLAKKSTTFTRILSFLSLILLAGLIAIFVLAKNRKKYINQLSYKNEELTHAKNKAEQLSKLKTKFFSTVSHEIRTPLYGVIGLSSILLDDKKLESHKEDLTSLKFSADYLLALINDVLMLSKMESNGVKLEKTPYKLSSLVNSITNSFAFLLEQNNNKLIVDIDSQIPNDLIGDSIRLSQILMNLIGNAVKFNENGNIWLSIKLIEVTNNNQYYSKFIVKDDGIGIPLEEQSAIFEEFSQVQNDNYSYQGTGLGLPIVVKLLDLHNSEIHLESTPNKGATFSFILPLTANLAIKNTNIENGNCLTKNKKEHIKNCHILIVDDNKINQKITKKILQTKNYNCSIASNGKDAIDLVKQNKYDLILMDINMPEVDGLEATKIIRTFNKTTPIVALTAVEDRGIRHKAFNSGMNDLILKPYDNLQFFSTILKNLSK
ncbi:response regulator [uncultured Lacinutrix sp.]|uniref:ATP-binding response regulator n=1 Tax=uncultured Lacinutrix sp. TaxID=574032 RepID=UPI00263554F2|nr:response regulator [uncultured Lacinutrix sp.]